MKNKKGIESSELRKKDPKSAYVTCRMPIEMMRRIDKKAKADSLSRSMYVLRLIKIGLAL